MPQFLSNQPKSPGLTETAINGVPKLRFDCVEDTLEAFSTITRHTTYGVSLL